MDYNYIVFTYVYVNVFVDDLAYFSIYFSIIPTQNIILFHSEFFSGLYIKNIYRIRIICLQLLNYSLVLVIYLPTYRSVICFM